MLRQEKCQLTISYVSDFTKRISNSMIYFKLCSQQQILMAVENYHQLKKNVTMCYCFVIYY